MRVEPRRMTAACLLAAGLLAGCSGPAPDPAAGTAPAAQPEAAGTADAGGPVPTGTVPGVPVPPAGDAPAASAAPARPAGADPRPAPPPVQSPGPAPAPPPAEHAPQPSAPPAPPGAPLGTEFRLPEGGTALVAGEGLTVTFSQLLTDSRCPRDVQCIWAGEVRIAVTLRQGGDAAGIELGDTLPPVGFRAYVVRLVAVDPYPVSGTEGGSKSAVLRVDRP